MSSDRSVSRRATARCLTVLAVLSPAVFLGLACGHKKPPKPPPSKVPQRVDLKVHQRGHEAIVSFRYPTTTISGTPLDGLAKVEVWSLAQEVPDFALEALAEEDARREEAQQLLDELGLSLYATPATVPGDPALPGAPPTPAAVTEGAAAAESASPPAEPPSTAAEEPQPPAAATPTAASEEGADTSASVAAAEDGDDDGEADGEDDGQDDGGDGEATENAATAELSAEEQLEIRIEAARNLLRSPPTTKSSFIQATPKDFRSDSELWLEIEGEAIDSALIGDLVVLRLPLPPRPTEGPEVGYVLASRIFSLRGKPSDFSSLVSLLPEAAPAAPQAVTVEAQADGIHVEWTAETDPKSGFRVYRREAQTRTYGEAVGNTTATERSYIDRQAVYGGRYIYAVTSLAGTLPVVESDISSEHEIDYQDRFGPPTPGGLVAFPEAGRVRLLWTTVADADLAGYEVLRRAAGEDEARVVTDALITGGQFLDQGVASGEWFYTVRAVDGSGNRSAASAEAPARVP